MREWQRKGLWEISPCDRWRIMAIECYHGEQFSLYDWHPPDHGLPRLVAVRATAEGARKAIELGER